MLPRPTVTVAAVLAGVAVVAVNAQPNTASCAFSFGNASFSLESMYNSAGYYMQDLRNSDTRRFLYWFNICGDAVLPTKGVQEACNRTTGDVPPYTKLSGPSPAFQLDDNAGLCKRLSDSSNDIAWSLFDATNPARGVAIEYKGGNTCYDTGLSRSLKIWLECTGNPVSQPMENVMVQETDKCTYEVFLKSQEACPEECPVVTNKLCSDHGVCGYDASQGVSRCFCTPGYTGADCATKDKKDGGLSAVAVVLIVVCVLMVFLLAGLVHFWRRVRTLRLDPQAYSMLRGGGGDDDAA